jgi:hypothetical protein
MKENDMLRSRPSAVILCALVLASSGFAQQAQLPQRQNDAAPVVRAYNVSDLVRLSSDYPLEVQIPKVAPVPNVGPLVNLIVETIDPASWGDAGGKISNLGTTLVVRQTGDNQTRIQQLLDELRRSTGPAHIVTVRTTWVVSSPRELPEPRTEVSLDWINKQKTYCESQLTCFSGQTVHITTGKNRQFISDLTPVVANGAVAYDPTITNLLSGVELQITPQVVPGNDLVLLDLQTTVNEVLPSEQPITVTATSRGEGANGMNQVTGNIDRVSVLSQEFKTTARVPLKKPVIVGGMTLEPAGADQQGGKQLYLVVQIDAAR